MDITEVISTIINAIIRDQPLDFTITFIVPVEGKNYEVTVKVKEV